jgi:hypothetical protein
MVEGGYPQEYVQFLAAFHGSRDFFECHDIMEALWKENGATPYTGCWLVFTRLAVACYHARRGNWAGARKMMAKAAEEIDPSRMDELGIDGHALARMLRQAAVAWSSEIHPVYRDFVLPLVDAGLEKQARQVCRDNGWIWGISSDQVDADIVNRHLTRDRTAVVEARRLAAERKRAARLTD